MKNRKSNISLPSVPSLIGSVEFDQLKDVVETLARGNVEPHVFDSFWLTALNEYKKWESSTGLHTSDLNRKLELYRLILLIFQGIAIRNNSGILRIIFSSRPDIGQKIKGRFLTGNDQHFEIIRREITDRFGILLTLKSDGGEIISREFFD